MLTKSQRFHGHNSLRPVYNKGRSVYGHSLKFIWTSSNGPISRAAVVVSKKVHKSAVVRNRIRRRLYAQLALFFKDASKGVGVDASRGTGKNTSVIVVVNDASLATVPTGHIKAEIATLK